MRQNTDSAERQNIAGPEAADPVLSRVDLGEIPYGYAVTAMQEWVRQRRDGTIGTPTRWLSSTNAAGRTPSSCGRRSRPTASWSRPYSKIGKANTKRKISSGLMGKGFGLEWFKAVLVLIRTG